MLAVYCRTSKSKEEGTDYSIETQQKGGIALAEQLGMPYDFFIDEGVSGTLPIDERPAFSELMSLLKQGKIKAIYSIDQSRIERATEVWSIFSAECILKKCKYYPNGIELDLNNEENMLNANLMSLFNSYYAKLTSRKVKLANKQKVKIGKTHGLKPYGFKRDSNNNYEIFEKEAQHVRTMFKLSLEGMGVYLIAKEFNKLNVPTKFNNFKGTIKRIDKYTKQERTFQKSNVMWRGNVIHDIIRNPIYKGVRVWNKSNLDERAEYKIDAVIIEPELWDKVNENLEKNKKNVGKKETYKYLLNGFIYCSHCGNQIVGKKRMKGRENTYKCKGKRPPHYGCTENRGIYLPRFETFIIKHLFESKDLKRLLVEAPRNNSETDNVREMLNSKKDEFIKVQKQVNKLYKLLKDPDLEDDENLKADYLDSKKKAKFLKEDIDILNLKLLEVENDLRSKKTKSLIESYTSEIGFDEIKRLIHSLIERIDIKHTKFNKSGIHTLIIKYKNFEDQSTFVTNWQSKEWKWINYYKPYTEDEQELQDEQDLVLYLLEKAGVDTSNEDLSGFKGFESISSKHESIVLNPEELIIFEDFEVIPY
jgi:site-specific DNA recombinase